jgi:cysteine-rich repeat protein
MSTFPNPWRNRKGPWVTPAASFSVINKDANAANLESKGSIPLSTFILNLPLYISKVPIMSQNLSILKQKLVPKSWDIVSSSWLETSCQLLSLNETECSISCTNLGIFAVEYNAELFVCGDGVRDLIEGCDDWNNVNGDGCDSRCNVESGWTCQKGKYPSEKIGFDICNRYPCYAPYNCRSKGLCLSDDTCFCDAGFFGDECNQTLPIYLQTRFNYTWIQLPFSLYAGYDAETEPLLILTVNRGGNLTHDVNGSTVVASVTVYKSEIFPEHSFRKNATSAADPELKSIFLSNIFEIRIATSGNIVVNAKGRVFLATHLSLPPPFLNFSLFNTTGGTTKNNANSTIQINLCTFSVLNKAWQPVEDSIKTEFLARRTVFEFNAAGPNYYALIASTRVMRSVVQEQLQPSESDYSIVAAIAAGISGGVFLIAALYTMWYIRRRNQRRMVLAAYYQATAAAARRNFFADSKNQNSIPPPPESGHAGPRKKQLNKTPVVQQPQQVSVLNAEPPPPIQGLSANKSLVAAAIRSKIKNANILHRSMPAFRLDQDLEFELDLTEDSETFLPRNSNDIEYFENLGDALEVDSVDSEGNGERQLDASSSCSAISLADKSDGSDLEDAGIAPPAMLPLNDFEDDLHSLNQSPNVEQANYNKKKNTFGAHSTLSKNTAATKSTFHSELVCSLTPVSTDGANLLHPSESSLRQNADLWKKQNNTSFDA